MSEREIRVDRVRIKAKRLIIEPDQVVIRRPSELEIEAREIEEE
ncbi:MAG: hypothetical protein QXI84_08800 [Thermofilaceae archaeon]